MENNFLEIDEEFKVELHDFLLNHLERCADKHQPFDALAEKIVREVYSLQVRYNNRALCRAKM